MTTDDHPVDQRPGVLSGHGGESGLERQTELLHQLGIDGVSRTHHLAAQLHQPAVGQRCLRHATPNPLSSLEHQDVRTRADQVPCRGQPGQPRAEHHRIKAHPVRLLHRLGSRHAVW